MSLRDLRRRAPVVRRVLYGDREDAIIKRRALDLWFKRAARLGLTPPLDAHAFFPNRPHNGKRLVEIGYKSKPRGVAVYEFCERTGGLRYAGQTAARETAIAALRHGALDGCPDVVFRVPPDPSPETADRVDVHWRWEARISIPRRVGSTRFFVHDHTWPCSLSSDVLPPDPAVCIHVAIPSGRHTRYAVFGPQDDHCHLRLVYLPDCRNFYGKWQNHYRSPNGAPRFWRGVLSQNDAAMIGAHIKSARIVNNRMVVSDEDLVWLHLLAEARTDIS